MDFAPLLLGKDARAASRSRAVLQYVGDQERFDELFNLLLHHERLLVVRAADAIEKVTLTRPEFLVPHKMQLLSLLKSALHKELKWHIALLITRVSLIPAELKEVWRTLSYWAQNPNERKIVRIHALQGLSDLARLHSDQQDGFEQVLDAMAHEQIPSLQARIKKLRKPKH
jgi:hypothetical protein